MSLGKKIAGSILLLLLFACGSFFVLAKIIFAEEEAAKEGREDRLLISEIQLGGASADDEFIELHNPNAYDVSLEGWSLKKKTKSGAEYGLLSDIGTRTDPATGLRDDSEAVLFIPAGGYFLIAPRYACGAGTEKCYRGEGAARADNYYSTKGSLAADNSLILYDGGRLADKVGWGKAADFEKEVFAAVVADGKSFGRAMADGAMRDTDDNSTDFFLNDIKSPRNASGEIVAAANSGDLSEGAGAEEEKETGSDAPAGAGADPFGEDAAPEPEAGPENPGKGPDDTASADAPETPKPEDGEVKIIITEILINPAGDDKQAEFIEIYNAGNAAADLGGWSLEDRAGKTGRYVFPEGERLKAGEYRVFYSSLTKLSLNNSGDGAVLKDKEGNAVHETALSDEAEENISFAGQGGKWFWTALPTPGGENIVKEREKSGKKETTKTGDREEDLEISEEQQGETKEAVSQEGAGGEDVAAPEPYDLADGIIISEILPDPVGRDNKAGNYEWVELYNENDRDVDLRGWCLDDIPGKGSKAFCFSENRIIARQGYLVVGSAETRLAFNNSDDEANLSRPDGRAADAVSYEKAKEGYSYSLDAAGDWRWSGKPTPGAANVLEEGKAVAKKAAGSTRTNSSKKAVKAAETGGIPDAPRGIEEEYEITPIAEAKKLPLGSRVGVRGSVSAPYGVLGKDIMYVSDGETGDGVQVAGSEEDLSALLLGDEIGVFGELGEIGGEKRLLARGAGRRISSDNELESFVLDFSDLKGSLGTLASVEGEISAAPGAALFYLKTEQGEIKIYAEPETGISFPDIKAGRRAAVTGILSRTSLGYRILPRFGSDIRFLENKDSGIMKTDEKAALASDSGHAVLGYSFLAALFFAFFGRKAAGRTRKPFPFGHAREERPRGGGKTTNP